LEGQHDVFESAARCFSGLGEPTRLRLLVLHVRGAQACCVHHARRATGMAQAPVSRLRA